MKVQFELTDTFGGEANYGWCRRDTIVVPEGTSEFLLMRLAREWAGWHDKNGRLLPIEVDHHSDSAGTIALRPKGVLHVLFITFDYDNSVADGVPSAPYDVVHLPDVLAWARRMATEGKTQQEINVAKAILETIKE
jgi:hypothetical protein